MAVNCELNCSLMTRDGILQIVQVTQPLEPTKLAYSQSIQCYIIDMTPPANFDRYRPQHWRFCLYSRRCHLENNNYENLIRYHTYLMVRRNIPSSLAHIASSVPSTIST